MIYNHNGKEVEVSSSLASMNGFDVATVESILEAASIELATSLLKSNDSPYALEHGTPQVRWSGIEDTATYTEDLPEGVEGVYYTECVLSIPVTSITKRDGDDVQPTTSDSHIELSFGGHSVVKIAIESDGDEHQASALECEILIQLTEEYAIISVKADSNDTRQWFNEEEVKDTLFNWLGYADIGINQIAFRN